MVTTPIAFHKVKEALTAKQVPIEASEVTYLPTSTVPVDAEAGQKLLKLIERWKKMKTCRMFRTTQSFRIRFWPEPRLPLFPADSSSYRPTQRDSNSLRLETWK